ncbi:ABC transporter ATP-binding protein [Actinoplanes italicus]|uniref:ATP-binding cassette subfamily B protein n=1 Tax=Actinoplanes italicus TaxID=113567 RepID=A0A2T0KI32_9ACTN|nr:ABC transporter ATP-binding protein [Actinoplanes italicus]PRX22897.1 ATP-binding cassette subfamily B protein [Actinoplanes italicus]GIE28419.1 ABC transporter ATP-binding protein [Actinoplanes italicus]
MTREPARYAREGDRLLIRCTRDMTGWAAALTLAQLTIAGLALLTPYLLAVAVDAALHRTGSWAVLALPACLAAGAVAGVVNTVAEAACVARGTRALRRRLLDHAFRLGVRGAWHFDTGDLTSRLVVSAAGTPPVVVAAAGSVIGVLTSIGGLAALWLVDWRCAAVFLLAVPVSAIVLRRFITDTSVLFTRYQARQAEISGRLGDALAGARTIRAAGTLGREIERVLAPLPALRAAGDSGWTAQRRVGWQTTLFTALIELAVLAVAGIGVADGRITAGQFLAAAAYVVLALGMVAQIEAFQGIAFARSAARRVAEVLARPVAATPGRPETLPPGAGEVRVRGLTVLGDDGGPILRDVDLDVPAGTTVALVGRNGAGKTTLAYALGGLLTPDRGTVLLDGRPPDALTGAAAYAFAGPHLCGATVADAISYGRPAATDADVRRAAAYARIDDFVDRLPDGYATALPEVALSGGEAQRLGLARAFAQQARLLVMDDATAGVDAVTEAQIAEALTGPAGGDTRVVVTHRAGTAGRADLVAWLDGGRVRAVAPHRDLWRDPAYRAVFADGTGTRP